MATGPEQILKLANRIIANIKNLGNDSIYVGIPQNKTSRKKGKSGDPTNNAYLGYIHEKGSDNAGIPPRPWLRPGVNNATPKVMKILEKASTAAAIHAKEGDDYNPRNHLMAAAMVAEAEVKRMFSSNDWPENTKATRRAKNKRHGKDKDSPVKPLIDIGELRKSISSVVAPTGSIEEMEG